MLELCVSCIAKRGQVELWLHVEKAIFAYTCYIDIQVLPH